MDKKRREKRVGKLTRTKKKKQKIKQRKLKLKKRILILKPLQILQIIIHLIKRKQLQKAD